MKIFGGGDDGVFYWAQAQNVVAGKDWTRVSIYPLILANLIKLTGTNSVYLIRLFNYLGFILLCLFSMSLIKTQFEFGKVDMKSESYIYNAKMFLLVIFLFYPSLLSINLSIYRDIWIYMLYLLSTYLSIQVIFLKRRRIIDIIVIVFSLIFLGLFRGYALFSFILAVGIYFLYKRIILFVKFKKLFFIGFLLFGIYYTFLMDFTILNMSLGKALNYRRSFLRTNPGGSQMWISLDKSNFLLFLINYIHSYIGNLVGPLPWHISGISTLFVFFTESIPMFFILKYLYEKKHLITEIQKYTLIHAFVWVSLIAVTNDNLGTATRLRPVAWILIVIVFVVVYSKNKYLKTFIRN